MRLSSFAFIISIPLVLSGQVPIQMKVDSGIIQYQDYYLVDNTLSGDTYYLTGWAASAMGMPVSGGLPIIGTMNDATSAACASVNIGVLQLDSFSWVTPALTHITTVNCMSEFGTGGASDTPTGWSGNCTGTTFGSCAWKNSNPYFKTNLFLPVQRQVTTGANDPAHDATVIMSPDKGVHWCNPYDMSINGGVCNSTVWSANGAAPKPSGDASYPGSIVWQALPAGYWSMRPIQYGQDGSYPSGVEPYCEPTVYTCFMFLNGVFGRWPNVDMVKLDPSTIQYYQGVVTPNYVPDPNDAANWTTTFANAKRTVRWSFLTDTTVDNTDFVGPTHMFEIVYLKEFKSYMMTGYTKFPGSVYNVSFATAPHPLGPWTNRYIAHDMNIGFATLNLGIQYTVVSTDPPEVLATISANNSVHLPQHTPYFHQVRLSWGPQVPYGTGKRAARNIQGPALTQNRGYQFSAGNLAKAFPKKNLIWAFDFLDHGANSAVSLNPYYRDVANNAAVMQFYGSEYHLAQGVQTFNTGDVHGLYTVTSDVNGKPNPVAKNIPTTIQGNSSLTVVGIFKLDTGGYPYGPFWSVGDQGGTGDTTNNNSVGLYWNGTNMEIRWAGRFRFTYKAESAFAPTVGNWYFYATTIQANGATPIYKTWVGCGVTNNVACFTDIMSGISRASTGGSPIQTPSISAGQFILGNDFTVPESLNASYAGVQIFEGVSSMQDIERIYKLYKSTIPLTIQ